MKSEWSIHPELQIGVRADRKRYHDYFANEYDRVSTSTGDSPLKISANIVSQLPTAQPGDIVRELEFKKFFHYEYLIRGLHSDHVEIFFRDHPAARVYTNVVTLFLQAQVIEPIAYYKLLEQGVLFMHAAGVTKGRSAYVFPAFGGTGKTTLTLGLLGEGMRVLGDDLLLVDTATGMVRPYLRPLHLFAYNVTSLRGARLPWAIRAQVRMKDFMRAVLERTTKQEFLISTRVHAEELYPDFRVGKKRAMARIVFLIKEGEDFELSTETDADEIVDRILQSEDLNDSLYQNILEPGEIDRCVALERDVIGRAIRLVDTVSFVNTRRLDFSDLSDFRDWLVSDGESATTR
ncbi:hypothetical protein [Demequina muriae]|uniref:HPr kinase n=1 Tax=Demequina muriae TaxID=3051664 RepID=A0ABT8GFC6_9MICO|nr:hypothetical protein [Demequina sp. EGI L300058]MDN4480130.1 hypothetical protein [Demequina sp. EGI L300058]